MHSALLRFLVLGCGLLLALPQGWCCMVRLQPAVSESKGDDPNPCSCCPYCKLPDKPSIPPIPGPKPLTPAECPCGDRASTAPDAPKVLTCDISLPGILPTIVLAPSCVQDDDLVSQLHFPSDHSLRLLHCIWLC